MEKIQSASEVNGLINGKVINFNHEGGFGFFKSNNSGENIYIPQHLVSKNALKNGMPIQVEFEEYTDKGTGKLKKRVKELIKT